MFCRPPVLEEKLVIGGFRKQADFRLEVLKIIYNYIYNKIALNLHINSAGFDVSSHTCARAYAPTHLFRCSSRCGACGR